MRVLGNATETLDVVAALHDALPPGCKKHRAGAIYDVAAVMKCFHKIDLKKAVKNLVANEIDDRLYGGLGRVQAESNRRNRKARGPSTAAREAGGYDENGETPGSAIADAIFGD
jgi:hypothetical protein